MRNRSSAIAITNNTKKRMTVELELNKDMNEDQKADKINQFLEDNLKMENKSANKTMKPDYNLGIPVPQYLDIKKDYISKNIKEKPILFHEKSKICSNLNKLFVGDIESYSQHVDFDSFLAQFKHEEEVNLLEIQDLLNIDFEKIGELKEKVSEYSDFASDLIQKDKEVDAKGELLIFMCDKMTELRRNEINIQVFINNIENVDSFCFSENKTEVYFK